VVTEQLNGGQGHHLVHFYRAEDELAERVGAYLAEALDGGGAAIAIASEPHLVAIGHKLEAVGINPRTAIAAGELILLDARATLDKLVIEGQVDREAFDREVGRTVRAAGRRHSTLRAYGEMVDLLWQDGDIPAAIELERVWNDLMARLRFTLLCAYQSSAVEAPEHGQGLQAICRLHSAQETSRAFHPDRTSPAAARRFMEVELRRWGHGESVIENARLVISELVTNAVIHTRSPFSVSIASSRLKVRLAVHDGSAAIPKTDRRSQDAPGGGRGLQIVAAVADDWGVSPTQAGKTVWAELSAKPAQ
jgi:anti-sigma regulatory factor (Ser/Thr protein kinase)